MEIETDDRTDVTGKTTVDQSSLAGIIGYRLRRAQIAIFQDFIESFASMNIRPVDYSILRLVGDNPGVRQGQLGEALGIKRANMVNLIHELEGRGLVERRAVAGDRRSRALHLTCEGKAFVAKLQEVWTVHEQRFIDRLGGEAERDRLIGLLDRIAGLP